MWLQVESDYSRKVTYGFDNMDVMVGLIRADSTVLSQRNTSCIGIG